MKSFQTLYIVLIALISYSAAKNLRQTLSQDNIDAFLLESQAYISILNFVQPNCPQCQQLQSKINTFIEQEEKDYITLAVVDCSQQPKLCSTMRVTEKPFIFIFDKNKQATQQYPGKLEPIERTYKKILSSISQLESQIKRQIHFNIQNSTRTENIRSQQQANRKQVTDDDIINQKFKQQKKYSKIITKSILLIISFGILVGLVFRQLYNVFIGQNSLLCDFIKSQPKNIVSIKSKKSIEAPQQQVKNFIPLAKNNKSLPKF